MLSRLIDKSYAFLSGMLGALIVMCLTIWLTPPTNAIATVDITTLTNQFIQSERSKNLSEDVLTKEAAIFGKQLEKNIKQLAHQYHLVILPKEAVMVGSVDYTQHIAKSLEKSMVHEEGGE